MTNKPRAAQIAHVLFVDVVGYSRVSLNEQARLMARLNAAVAATPAFIDAKAGEAVHPIPSGDGMALLFADDVTAPARCAVEVARALDRIADSASGTVALTVRMGIHSGLVQRQIDIAGGENFVGEGINTAQRVMDSGGAGDIRLSAQYASWLQQFDDWAPHIVPLGDHVAKHGLRLSLFALHLASDTSDTAAEEARYTALPPVLPRPKKIKGGNSGVGASPISPKVALLYRRDALPDLTVLALIEERLSAEGFGVFVDRHSGISVDWVREVEQRIREADAVVAIVSPKAFQSEMLEYEIETAHDQFGRTGKPLILPVRIGIENGVEGSVGAIIAPLNQFYWNGSDDDHRLVAELISAIREPLKPRAADVRLEPVGGAVPPDSPFYIERACDTELTAALDARETILLIKGPRQVGKTSLQARGARQAREHGWRVGFTDFQKLNMAQMANEDIFYRLLAATLARQLKFSYDFASEWSNLFGANLNLENFLCELLDSSDEPLVWCMDEVDKLFSAPFASDFFGLVRSWHNSRSTEPGGPWDKLTVIIAYATEAHLFIQDLNQSPFNVGRRLDLEDFNLKQMVDLNRRYGGPLKSYAEAEALYELVSGQPYLTRCSLDALATGKHNLAGLLAEANQDGGPFSEHLKRIFVSVSRLPAVVAFVHTVLAGTATPYADQESYYRLLAAGVIKQKRDGQIRFRCELYRRYLAAHLV